MLNSLIFCIDRIVIFCCPLDGSYYNQGRKCCCKSAGHCWHFHLLCLSAILVLPSSFLPLSVHWAHGSAVALFGSKHSTRLDLRLRRKWFVNCPWQRYLIRFSDKFHSLFHVHKFFDNLLLFKNFYLSVRLFACFISSWKLHSFAVLWVRIWIGSDPHRFAGSGSESVSAVNACRSGSGLNDEITPRSIKFPPKFVSRVGGVGWFGYARPRIRIY